MMNGLLAGFPDDDMVFEQLDIDGLDTQGFCAGYQLRRHKHEDAAITGYHEARSDWHRHIGPIEQFGGANPIHGDFTSLALPLCIEPRRLRHIAYILEYAFLYDNVLESANKAAELASDMDRLVLNETESMTARAVTGAKQIQAKMIHELMSIDSACAKRVVDAWKTMASTTTRDKSKDFQSIDEYVDFRIIDTGAPFVDALMLWGLGMTLTKEEDELLAPILRPRHAAVGLANDYFSFDREYEEFRSDVLPTKQMSEKATLTNSVYLFMGLQNVDVAAAKELVKAETIKYEQEFLQRWRGFLHSSTPVSEKLRRCLEAHSFQVSGNVVWSLQCPRYHPAYRYDANAGTKLEKALISAIRRPDVSSIVAEIARVCAEASGAKAHLDRTVHTRNGSGSSCGSSPDSSPTTSTASSPAITSPEASFQQSHSRSLSSNLQQGLKERLHP